MKDRPYAAASDRAIQIIKHKLIIPHMDEHNITTYRLAQMTGINRSTLSKWFSGQTDLKLSTFLQILGALGIKPVFTTEGIDVDFVEHFN